MKVYRYILNAKDCVIIKESYEAKEYNTLYKITDRFGTPGAVKKELFGTVDDTFVPRIWMANEDDALACELFSEWLAQGIKKTEEVVSSIEEHLVSCREELELLENSKIRIEVVK